MFALDVHSRAESVRPPLQGAVAGGGIARCTLRHIQLRNCNLRMQRFGSAKGMNNIDPSDVGRHPRRRHDHVSVSSTRWKLASLSEVALPTRDESSVGTGHRPPNHYIPW